MLQRSFRPTTTDVVERIWRVLGLAIFICLVASLREEEHASFGRIGTLRLLKVEV